MILIKFPLGRGINLLTEADCKKAVEQLTNLEVKQAEKYLKEQLKAEATKPLSQDAEDVNKFVKTVKEHNGIVEYSLKQILGFSNRRFERTRSHTLSFTMGLITLDKRSRVYTHHNPSECLKQETLI